MSLLEVRDLKVAIRIRGRDIPVVRDVNLHLEAGSVCGLVGESGAGKSMIARAVLDLLPRAARIVGGDIRFDGRSLLALSGSARRRLLGKDIALIPQDPMMALNPARRIGDQIDDGLILHLRLDRAAARARSKELLGEVLIRDPERVLKAYPHELSGGMRQRVLIAMAFSCEPRLIIADEPTTALDVTVQKRVLGLIRMLQQREQTALLFVSHDLGVVAKLCDQVVVLYDGRVLEEASAQMLFSRPSHPYTRALLAAMPRFDQPHQQIDTVPQALIAALTEETAELDGQIKGQINNQPND